MQDRFLRIMERVQQGGIEQMEHVKRPELFTGSWMANVSSHQQLLGTVLRDVPGPEACIRVFNLMRPPPRFPSIRGDERDIIAYYQGETGKALGSSAWAGDPHAGSSQEGSLAEHRDRDVVSLSRHTEALRVNLEQKTELEAQRRQVDVLREENSKMCFAQDELGDYHEVREQKHDLARVKRQSEQRVQALEVSESEARQMQGELYVLRVELGREQSHGSEMLEEQRLARQRLEREWTLRGEDQSWRLLFEQERQRAELLQARYGGELLDASEQAASAKAAAAQLRFDGKQAELELAQLAAATAEAEMLRNQAHAGHARLDAAERELRQEASERALLRQEVGAQRAQLAAAQEAGAAGLAAVERKARAAAEEAATVRSLEDTVERLHNEMRTQDECWRNMFSKYPLIGQALFGSDAS